MADLTKTISIIFAGIDKVSPIAEDIGGGISKVASGVQSATQPFADLSDNVLLASGAITALGLAALAFSTKEAVALESSMTDLNKVLGETDGTATDFADKFADISNTFGIAQSDIIQLTADFKQSGFTIDESLDLVSKALTAVSISELDANQSGEAIIRTLNGFQAPASEAGRLLDILNEVSNNNSASFSELAIGMARLSPIAKGLGLSFEETAGLLTPVIAVFGSGSEAANGLRTSLLKLGSDSKPVIEALESVGIDTSEFVTAKDRLQALTDVFPSLTKEQQNFVTKEIAGIEQAAKFSIVLSNQEGVLKATENAYKSLGSAQKELDIALKTTEIALQRFGVSLSNIAAKVGSEFLPQFKEVVNSSADLGDAILKALDSKAFEPVFDALRDFFDGLDKDIQLISKNFPEAIKLVDFTPILDALNSVQSSFGKLFSELDLSTPEGLASAIQFIVDSTASLFEVTAGIIGSFEDVFKTVANGADDFNDLGADVKEAAGNFLGFAKQVNVFAGYLESLGGVIAGVGSALGVLFGAKGIIAFASVFKTISAGSAASAVVAGLATSIALLAGIVIEADNKGVSRFLDDVFDISGSQGFAAETVKNFGEAIGGLSDQLFSGKLSTQEYIAEMERLNDKQIIAKFATQDNTKKNRENTLSLLKTSEAIKDFKDNVVGAATASGDLSQSSDEVTKKADSATNSTKSWADSISALEQQAKEFSENKLSESLNEASSGIDGATDKTKKLKDGLKEGSVVVKEFKGEIETVGNKVINLYGAIDDANTDIKVSVKASGILTAEQQVRQFESVLNALDTSIESTGNTLGSLAGSLTGGNFNNLDLASKFSLRNAFDEETKQRKDSIKIANELAAVELKVAQARLDALNSGDAGITIDTSGLDPILDLLLVTIIENAQVRASTEGAAFLVGGI